MVSILEIQKKYNFFIGLFMLDGILTFIGLSSGFFVELNPLVNYVLSVHGIFFTTIIFKFIATGLLFFIGLFVFSRLKKQKLNNIPGLKIYNFLISGCLLGYISLIIYELYLLGGVLL